MKLEPAVRSIDTRPIWQRQPAGLLCAAVGLTSLIAAAAMVLGQDALFEAMPDLRVTASLWALAAVAGAVSALRRERGAGLVVAGVAMASAALALAWVLVLVAVAAVTLLVIALMSELF
jgi:hypothetical protein